MTNRPTVYALGFFDGVHLAHQALLDACRTMAEDLGCQAGVITFQNHPDERVMGTAPALINTYDDRNRLLKYYGMEQITALVFDQALMQTPWQTFAQALLDDHHAAGLVCGEDFRFGHLGEGTAEKLQSFCREQNIPCTVVPCQKMEDTIVSSTHIRKLLAKGELETANAFLGHPYMLTGTVVSGRQLGRTLGFPTANLCIPEGLVMLPFGVYACRAYVDGAVYLAVTNIGNRPTVGGHHATVEAYLLDFTGDLYGKPLTLTFHAFLRGEKKFPDLQTLAQEIAENGAQTKKILGNL